MLYPRESETREIKDLSGFWRFRADPGESGFKKAWHRRALEEAVPMAVPASFNDLTQDAALRDYVGWVWYQTDSFAPEAWRDKKVSLRVGAASHRAVLYCNGHEIARHEGGFLPFAGDASPHLKYGASNRITVAIDNRLNWNSLPVGRVTTYNDAVHPAGFKVQEIFADFFNFSGIHRPVRFVVTPKECIEDVTLFTGLQGAAGTVDYHILRTGRGRIKVRILAGDGTCVAAGGNSKGKITIRNVKAWSPDHPHLYIFEASLVSGDGRLLDRYRLPFGVRTVEVRGARFLLNGKPVYFKGFGKHEDADIRGKGLDEAINLKDFNLLKWTGANSFRTSHYPYCEEIMNLADEQGFMVIDEVPAVGMNLWNPNERIFRKGRVDKKTQAAHLRQMEELIIRDKNHPCVIMWSVGNEPASCEKECGAYFKPVFRLTRRLDPSRPVTCVVNADWDRCTVTALSDVVCVNRYFAWYGDSGRLDLIGHQLKRDLTSWHRRFPGKPVFLTEFGADAVAGVHTLPPKMFSEEFQCDFLKEYFKVLDSLSFVVGEHVWCFADFATKQSVMRVTGNRKGVFTRAREPKAAAFLLRERWNGLRPR